MKFLRMKRVLLILLFASVVAIKDIKKGEILTKKTYGLKDQETATLMHQIILSS